MTTETRRAATVATPNAADPAAAVEIAELPPATAPEPDWSEVEVVASTLNMHDVWMLGGVGVEPSLLPLILGSDAAGHCDGREVIVHAILSATVGDGDETLARDFGLLSDKGHGTLAERIMVPTRNLVAKPASLTFEEAAALPTSWLTAYRMLFTKAELQPGQTVLVQGAGGGVATAAVLLGRAIGADVFVTSRSEAKRERALELGAAAALEPGARLPQLADVVIESVGQETWESSLRSCASGAAVIVCGATSGREASTDLARLFARQIRIFGSTMGTVGELAALAEFVEQHGIHPPIDSVMPLSATAAQVRRMTAGDAFGKLAIRVTG